MTEIHRLRDAVIDGVYEEQRRAFSGTASHVLGTNRFQTSSIYRAKRSCLLIDLLARAHENLVGFDNRRWFMSNEEDLPLPNGEHIALLRAVSDRVESVGWGFPIGL